jgi:predicted transporter
MRRSSREVLTGIALPVAARIGLALVVGLWFGIWFFGPVVLLAVGLDDPRNVFSEPVTMVGCAVLVGGWLYFVIHALIFGELP